MPIERKLAAIMFTDIAGYTALSAKDETKALNLLDTQKQILTPIIEEFNGILHKEMGDGLLFTFPTVSEAVKCGIKIQEHTKNSADLNLRIGIHEGEITLKDGDALGDDVNVASRIEPFSAVGGIAISSKVQQNISSLTEFETSYVGKPELKGVAQEVKVYCITSHGLPKADEIIGPIIVESKSNFNVFALIGGIAVLIGILFFVFQEEEETVPSIAIIPLENKGESKDEFYSYSISADLISDVSGAGDIRVASLKDIEKLDYKSLTNEEIAKKLLVRYISQGTLWKVDSVFQLSMELYDTKKNKVAWSNNWQQNWSELPSIKGGLSGNILTNLQVTTTQDIAKAETKNAEAYTLYLQAKNIYQKRENIDDTEIAQTLLNKAIELDENLIAAKLILGDSYREVGDSDKAMEIYSSALTKSKELDDKLWVGRSTRKIGIMHANKDTALEYYERSLTIAEEIGDKSGMGHSLNNIGNIHDNKGDYDKALDYYERSLTIREEIGDKYGMGYSLNSIGYLHKIKGDLDTALDYYERSLAIREEIGDKDNIRWSYQNLGWLKCHLLGDYDKSNGYYDKQLVLAKELKDNNNISNIFTNKGLNYFYNKDFTQALEHFEKSKIIQIDLNNTVSLETISYLLLTKKVLGQKYNIEEIAPLIEKSKNNEDYISFAIFKLLEDNSYLETAYNQVQDKVLAMDKDLAKKFLSSPIPKAIVEEWETFNKDKN